jgi:signal transduction histidine kinase
MTIVQSGLPLALSIPLLAATWIAFVGRRRSAVRHNDGTYVTAATGSINATSDFVDLVAAIHEAVLAAESVANLRWVRIELALEASMAVLVDPGVLRTALLDTILSAINAAPGGEVLITAATLGSQLHIRITDDSPETDQFRREMTLRQTRALIALQGGSIAVEAQKGRGTTIAMRLPFPATVEQTADILVEPSVLADQAA